VTGRRRGWAAEPSFRSPHRIGAPFEEAPGAAAGGLFAIYGRMPVTVDEVREFAATLPRAYEAFVRGRLKLRVGQIVFVAFSKDGAEMGLGFPKDWRDAAVQSEPATYSLPGASDLRFNWIHVRLAALDRAQMEDLVEDAWALCVPKFLVETRRRAARVRAAARGDGSASP